MKAGLMAPSVLVDLKLVPELEGVDADDSEIVIRARATHREVSAASVVRDDAAILSEATRLLGNARVRATGTLAGNLCFAEPRSDVMTALLALEAQVDLVGSGGRRSVGLDDFLGGPFTTAREEHELVEAIRVPRRKVRGTYVRFQPNEYPTVSVALVDRADGAGTRVVVGAVGERPDAYTASDPGSVEPRAIADAVDVTEDLNGSEEYKRHLVAVMVGRAVERLRSEERHG
jgi:carbon-monoxide dehydrogenase medium subunit